MPFEADHSRAHFSVKWRMSGGVSYQTDLVILNRDRIWLHTHPHCEGAMLWISDKDMARIRRLTSCFRG